jgi:Crinkler effector protein N-terminal domain
VKDDYYKHAFEVKIGKEEPVATLKKDMKEEKSQTFREVDAGSLVLWNENIRLFFQLQVSTFVSYHSFSMIMHLLLH